MKSQIRFTIDKDLVIAIIIGIIGSLVALAMFFLSGYMVTQSALGAPLYALMVLVVSVKLFGFYVLLLDIMKDYILIERHSPC